MNWRIPVVAVMVVGAFAGFAFFYYKGFVQKRSHGVILFVVNGLDADLLHQARLTTQAARSRETLTKAKPGMLNASAADRVALQAKIFSLEEMPNLAMLSVQGPGDPVADVGAVSTALACGQRVPNGRIACDALGQPLDTLIYAAQRSGRATGLISTDTLTAPTPVAFYAAMKSGDRPHTAAAALADYARIDVILGGGRQYFEPLNVTNLEGRRDRRDLIEEMKKNGYTFVSDKKGLEDVPAWRTRRLLGLFTPGQFYYEGPGDRHPELPSLADLTRRAIECLHYNVGGYFLVIEHGLVQRAGEKNFTGLSLEEVQAFDEALRVACDYTESNALILVTNNFSLGSQAKTVALDQPPALVAEPEEMPPPPSKKNRSRKKPVASAKPEETRLEKIPPRELLVVPNWLSGPGGPRITQPQRAWYEAQVASGLFQADAGQVRHPDLAARFSTMAVPTAQPAWMAGRGLYSERFSGFLSNTEVFQLLKDSF